MRSRIAIGVFIFLFALVLRLCGIGWGLKNELHNQSYHPDEFPIFSQSQHLDPLKGNFVPGFYNYGTFYLSLLNVTSHLTGKPEGNDEDANWEWAAKTTLAGRVLTAVAGAGTCVMVYACVLLFASTWGAAFAALFLAVAPAHVMHSRFQTVDVLALFLLTCSTYFALKLLSLPKVDKDDPEGFTRDESGKLRAHKDPGLKLAILAGIFAGLSAGTKYAGGLTILTFVAAILLGRRKRWLLESILAVVTTALAFLMTTPGALLDNKQFMADMAFEAKHMSDGQGFVFAGTSSGYLYHLQNLAVGLGIVALLVAAAAWIGAFSKKQTWALALAAFWLPYFLLIGNSEVKFLRYTFPLYVALAIAFGWGIGALEGKKWLAPVVGLASLAMGAFSTLMTTLQMSGPDSRDLAARYIRSIAKPETQVGFPRFPWYWSVPLEKNTVLPGTIPMPQRLELLDKDSEPHVVLALDGDRPTIFDPRLITDLKPEIVTYTALESRDLQRLSPNDPSLPPPFAEAVAKAKKFFEEVEKNYTLDKEFGQEAPFPEDMAYFNPKVWVWRRR